MPLPIRTDAVGLDLSPRFQRTTTVAASPTGATETIIATLAMANFADLSVVNGVFVSGWAAYTLGAGATSATLRIRQTNVTGSVIANTGAQTGGVGSGPVVLTASLTPAAVAANTTAEQSFTGFSNAATDVALGVSKPTAQAGLGIVGQRIIDATHVGITFSNNTGAGITPTAAETYSVLVMRPGGQLTAFDVEGFDSGAGVGTYVLTLTVAGATAGSTVSAVLLRAIVV